MVPCFNEQATLEKCIQQLLAIHNDSLHVEIIIVDDCSTDDSARIASALAAKNPEIRFVRHFRNLGKGAALHTGFGAASGDFVTIQDADLEYNPRDLLRLIQPLIDGRADVVFGSRFLSGGEHRVLYFWHSVGNQILTLLSNMLTDLNLTDMETCYKVFAGHVVKKLQLKEQRFGFEPEVVAKVAQMRLRIYEIGISYYGRTYAEGKKVGAKDGFRAVYCILKYNLHRSSWPIQFFFYSFIGGACALLNLVAFLLGLRLGVTLEGSAAMAFILAAAANYVLSVAILFRHKARWNSATEVITFVAVTAFIGLIDILTTRSLVLLGMPTAAAKALSSLIGLALNFAGRRWIVFAEPGNPDWRPQEKSAFRSEMTAAECGSAPGGPRLLPRG